MITGVMLLAMMAQEPLTAQGKWAIIPSGDACVLQRTFGTGEASTTLAFRQMPVAEFVDVITFAKGPPRKRKQGSGEVTLTPMTRRVAGDYEAFDSPEPSGRVVKLTLKAADLADLAAATGITVEADGATKAVALPTTFAKALTAWADCGDGLMRQWGGDPVAYRAIIKPAEPIKPETWISSDNYPPDARHRGAQGTTQMFWRIDERGRVSDCRSTISAGDASLDQAACAAITANGRYRPALDAAGNPVPSWATRHVKWVMPR